MIQQASVERRQLSRQALRSFLESPDRSASTPPGRTLRTLARPDGHSDDAGLQVLAPTVPEDALTAALRSETGAVVYSSDTQGHVILPPFPLTAPYEASGWDTEPL